MVCVDTCVYVAVHVSDRVSPFLVSEEVVDGSVSFCVKRWCVADCFILPVGDEVLGAFREKGVRKGGVGIDKIVLNLDRLSSTPCPSA